MQYLSIYLVSEIMTIARKCFVAKILAWVFYVKFTLTLGQRNVKEKVNIYIIQTIYMMYWFLIIYIHVYL